MYIALLASNDAEKVATGATADASMRFMRCMSAEPRFSIVRLLPPSPCEPDFRCFHSESRSYPIELRVLEFW